VLRSEKWQAFSSVLATIISEERNIILYRGGGGEEDAITLEMGDNRDINFLPPQEEDTPMSKKEGRSVGRNAKLEWKAFPEADTSSIEGERKSF